MTSKNPFLSALAIYGGRISSAVIQALALIALAGAVSPAILGVVSVAIAIISAIGIISQLGLESSAGRAVAQGRKNAAIRVKLYHNLIMFAVAIIAAGVISIIYFFNIDQFPSALILLAPWVFIERQNALKINVAVADGHAIRASFSMAIGKILGAVIFYTSIEWQVFDPVINYILFLNISSLVSSLVLPRLQADHLDESNPLSFLESLEEARPFWVASLSGQARNMDVVLVGSLAGSTSAGLYAFPARAVGPLRLVSTSLGAIAMPSAARKDWRQVNQLERGMWVVCLFFILGTIIVWWEGPKTMAILLGEEYAASAPILSILMLGVAFNIPGALWSAILQGAGRASIVARIGVWLVPIYYILVIAGIFFDGAKGAALGVSATFIVQFVIMFLFRVRKDWPGK